MTFLGMLHVLFSGFYKNLGYEKNNETQKEILSNPNFFLDVALPTIWSLIKH